MATATALQISEFGRDVLAGLTHPTQKWLSPKYFYDELGSALFEAITALPEYGLTQADQRLLETYAPAIARLSGFPAVVVELGSGSGRKTRHVLSVLSQPVYYPIDISTAALDFCAGQLQDVATVRTLHADWLSGLNTLSQERGNQPLLLLFLGSSIGNLSRADMPSFFSSISCALRPGDHFLLGADLIKPIPSMINAYDDSTGVTAAFNRNILARINRELGANFNLRSFRHEARWNDVERAIEMHLVATTSQIVTIDALETCIQFHKNESIWTESSHKFTLGELGAYAHASGFMPVTTWTDEQWPFVEALWKVGQ